MLVLLTLVAASFFFALAESALFSLGSWRARRLLESGRRGSERVGNLLAHPADVLAAIALGNTLSNSLLVALTVGSGLDVRGDSQSTGRSEPRGLGLESR
jgi:Mg2+/Co2+ transporter CorB